MWLNILNNILIKGCDISHAYCTKPNECLCLNGWSGENCTECIVQPNCPGTCSVPHGCVCSDSMANGLCKIEDDPPKQREAKKSSNLMLNHCLNSNNVHFNETDVNSIHRILTFATVSIPSTTESTSTKIFIDPTPRKEFEDQSNELNEGIA